MEFDTAWTKIQSGWGTLATLTVTYSLSVLGAVMLLVAGYLAAGLVERATRNGLGRIHGFDATLTYFFSQVARYGVLALVLVMVLGQFGVQTASIIAAIGAAGLAIGLALQGTLQNIAAGIMLLILRPFRVGDSIKVGAIEGDVEEIGLFATRLRGADGTYILAPNSKLWNEPVYNVNRNGVRRADITVNVGFGNDVERVQQMLVGLAAADRRVRRQPAPIAFVSAMTEASAAVNLRYWTSDRDNFASKNDLTARALTLLRTNGIAFAPLAQVPPPAPPKAAVPEEEDEAPVASRERETARPTRQ